MQRQLSAVASRAGVSATRPAGVARVAAAACAAHAPVVPARNLNVHEFQSQAIMRKFGVRVPEGKPATNVNDAVLAFREFGQNGVVVKAQVLAGGRGLGYFDNGFRGGVHVCDNEMQVRFAARNMLAQKLITKQTGEQGRPVNTLLVAKKMPIRREMYFAILLDRAFGGPVMVGSAVGGVTIEDLAHKNPDAIIKIPVNPYTGPSDQQATQMAQKLGFSKPEQVADCVEQVKNLWNLFSQCDATMIEVNPFVEAGDGKVMAFDAKLNFDDNAAFRQKEIHQLYDPDQQDSREVAAAKWDLNYIGLDGNIGCLVNGAGLAMATMDIIKLNGGSPANFLDVGGGATSEQVTEAVRILATDPKVTAILVNIFGGIMRCDVIAEGLITAVNTLHINTPLIVRLQGTNVDAAKALIAKSGMRIYAYDDLDMAAQKAVEKAHDEKNTAPKYQLGL